MITLYHVNNSRSARSLWLLHELGLEFEVVEMPFTMAALRTPEYLAISPLGRVPCLVDGELTLFESGAICQYLCETYDEIGFYRPPGHAERVAWLQWLHYAETVAVHCAALIQQRVFISEEHRSPAVIKLESKRLEKSMQVLDHHLSGREFLLDSGFSAVDTAVAYSVHLGFQLHEVPSVPNLRDYYERCKSREGFKRTFGEQEGSAQF